MKKLHTKLNEAGYICNEPFAAAVRAALDTKPVAGAFLFGPIGTGKSYLPEILSGTLDADYWFYQCFPGTREEDLLMKMLPNENTISGIGLHEGVMLKAVASTCKKDSDKPVILVLDEWDKTRPSADSFLLDFLQTGRVNFSGREYTANLGRLIVFLTLNVEREISEPLLRRLPKIDFQPLSPSLVYKALQLTHRGHKYLHNAVVLYERCLTANLPKPATIQELRQLLDGIDSLGQYADWDSLVYQFVTKTDENHELLRRAEKEKTVWKPPFRPRLDLDAYEAGIKAYYSDLSDLEAGAMPRLHQARGFDERISPEKHEPDLSSSGGIIQLTPDSYSEIVRMVDEPGDRPDQLGSLAEVAGDYLTFNNPLPLCKIQELDGLWGEIGEILLVEPLARWQDVKAMQDWADMKIVKFSQKEILARSEGVDLRWTPDMGAEIIVDLGKRHIFEHIFGMGWGRIGESKWTGAKGLIYLRHKQLEKEQEGAERLKIERLPVLRKN